jgi:hypothetical protein
VDEALKNLFLHYFVYNDDESVSAFVLSCFYPVAIIPAVCLNGQLLKLVTIYGTSVP